MSPGWIIVSVAALTACNTNLALAPKTKIECTKNADCPVGLVCAVKIDRCVTTVDNVAPRLVSASAMNAVQVLVVFDKPIAQAPATAFTITPALAVSDAVFDASRQNITLFTAPQIPGTAYTLTPNGLVDESGNAIDSTASEASFVGFGVPPDSTAPPDEQPAAHARVFGPQVTLVWAPRAGATQYVVDLASDATLQNPVSGSPFTVLAAKNSLTTSLPAALTYYWRVHADTTIDEPQVQDFDLVLDTLDVYCPAAASCSDTGPTITNGSQTRPYQTLQRAIAAAAELSASAGGVPAISVAARGGGAAYVGPVDIQGGPLTLNGGYDPTFTLRDATTNPTLITGVGVTMVILEATHPVTIDGFTIAGTGTQSATALSVSKSTDAVSISNCILTSNSSGINSSALSVTESPAPGPLFDHLTISTGDLARAVPDTQTVGVDISQSAAQLDHLSITAGQAYSSEAIAVSGPLLGDVTIKNSLLQSSLAGANSLGIYATSNGASPGQIIVSTTQIFTGSPDSLGNFLAPAAYVSNLMSMRIDRSLLAGASSPYRAYGLVAFGGSVVLSNSIVTSGIGLAGGSSFAVSLQNAVSATIADSTLVAGESSTNGGQNALELEASHPIVSNSILATWSSDASTACVTEAGNSTAADPLSFQNNLLLLGCATAYVDVTNGASTLINSAVALNALDGNNVEIGTCVASINCNTSRYSGNLLSGANLFAIFNDPDGADNDFYGFADNDFSLAAACPASVTSGGKDTTGSDCGSHQAPASCGGSIQNYAGTTRTMPFSLGAY